MRLVFAHPFSDGRDGHGEACGEHEHRPEYGTAEGHAGVILDFITARAEGRAPLTAGADNIRSLAMTFAAIESAEAGRRIDITQEHT